MSSPTAPEDEVEQHAARPDVHALRVEPLLADLGGQVPDGAEEGAGEAVVQDGGKAEVDQLHGRVLGRRVGEQQVLRLEVAVHHAALVHVGDGRHDLGVGTQHQHSGHAG